jgi:hypothetical protein
MRSFAGLIGLYDSLDEVIEYLAVLPVVVVSLAWERIPAEPVIVGFGEIEGNVISVFAKPRPRDIQFESNGITEIIVVSPLDSVIDLLQGRPGFKVLPKVLPEYQVLVDSIAAGTQLLNARPELPARGRRRRPATPRSQLLKSECHAAGSGSRLVRGGCRLSVYRRSSRGALGNPCFT